jgi:hypothetical protein
MRPCYCDKATWSKSYIKEHSRLMDHETYDTITESIWYLKYPNIPVLSSMVVQTVKRNEFGNPVHAKSRSMVLGNYEDTPWGPKVKNMLLPFEKEAIAFLHLWPSALAIDLGRTQKQGDYKNAFYHPILPKNKKIIIRPPPAVLSASLVNCAALNIGLINLKV